MEKTKSDSSNKSGRMALHASLSTDAIMQHDGDHVQITPCGNENNSAPVSVDENSQVKKSRVEERNESVDDSSEIMEEGAEKGSPSQRVDHKASVHDEAVRDLKKALRETHLRGQSAVITRRNSDPGTQNPTWFGEIATPGGFRRHFVLSKKKDDAEEANDRRRSSSRLSVDQDDTIEGRRSRTSRGEEDDDEICRARTSPDHVSAHELPPALRPKSGIDGTPKLAAIREQHQSQPEARGRTCERETHQPELRYSYQFNTKRKTSLKAERSASFRAKQGSRGKNLERSASSNNSRYLSEKAALLAKMESNDSCDSRSSRPQAPGSPVSLEAIPAESPGGLRSTTPLRNAPGSPSIMSSSATLLEDMIMTKEMSEDAVGAKIANAQYIRNSTSSSTLHGGTHNITTTDACDEGTSRGTSDHPSGPPSPDRINSANYELAEGIMPPIPYTEGGCSPVVAVLKKEDSMNGETTTTITLEESSNGRVFEVRSNFNDNHSNTPPAAMSRVLSHVDSQDFDLPTHRIEEKASGIHDSIVLRKSQSGRRDSLENGSPRGRTWSANSSNKRNFAKNPVKNETKTTRSRVNSTSDKDVNKDDTCRKSKADTTMNSNNFAATLSVVRNSNAAATSSTITCTRKRNSSQTRKLSHQANVSNHHVRSRSTNTGARSASRGRDSGSKARGFSAFGLRGASTNGKPKPNVRYAKIPLLTQLWDPQFCFPGVCPPKHSFEDDDSDVDESEKRDAFVCPEDIMEQGHHHGVRRKSEKKKLKHKSESSTAVTKPLLGKKKKDVQHYGATEEIDEPESEALVQREEYVLTKKKKKVKCLTRPDVSPDLGDGTKTTAVEEGGESGGRGLLLAPHGSDMTSSTDLDVEIEEEESEDEDVDADVDSEEEDVSEDVSEDSGPLLDKYGKPMGQASTVTTVIVLIKTWLGMNALVMPHALQNCGLAVGIVVLPLTLCLMLTAVVVVINLRRHIGVPTTMTEMMTQVLGKKGGNFFSIVVLGLQTGFFMFELDAITSTWQGPAKRWISTDCPRSCIVMAVTLCCTPLVLVRKLHYFVYSSFFGMITLMMAIAYLLFRIYGHVLSGEDYMHPSDTYPEVYVPAHELLDDAGYKLWKASPTGPDAGYVDILNGEFARMNAAAAGRTTHRYPTLTVEDYVGGNIKLSRDGMNGDESWGYIARTEKQWTTDFTGVMHGVAHAVFCFACLNTQLPMYESHRDKDNYFKALLPVVGGVIVIFMLIAVPWYLYFTSATSLRPMENMDAMLAADAQTPRVVSFLLGICGICTQPINFYILPATYEPVLFGKMQQGFKRKWLKNVTRVGLVLLMGVFCVLAADYMQSFLSLVAALCVSPVCLILPPYLHWKIKQPTGWEKYLDFFLMGFGVLAFGISMFSAIHGVLYPLHDGPIFIDKDHLKAPGVNQTHLKFLTTPVGE